MIRSLSKTMLKLTLSLSFSVGNVLPWLILLTLLSIIYLTFFVSPNTLKGIIAIDNIRAFPSDTIITTKAGMTF